MSITRLIIVTQTIQLIIIVFLKTTSRDSLPVATIFLTCGFRVEFYLNLANHNNFFLNDSPPNHRLNCT